MVLISYFIFIINFDSIFMSLSSGLGQGERNPYNLPSTHGMTQILDI